MRMNVIVQSRRRRGPFQALLAAMTLTALLASAPAARAQDLSTRQWLALCETDLGACETEVALADAALRAVHGGLGGTPATVYCSIIPDLLDESAATPEDEERTIPELAAATQAARRWLADRPDLAEEHTSRSVIDALLAIYPCPQ